MGSKENPNVKHPQARKNTRKIWKKSSPLCFFVLQSYVEKITSLYLFLGFSLLINIGLQVLMYPKEFFFYFQKPKQNRIFGSDNRRRGAQNQCKAGDAAPYNSPQRRGALDQYKTSDASPSPLSSIFNFFPFSSI